MGVNDSSTTVSGSWSQGVYLCRGGIERCVKTYPSRWFWRKISWRWKIRIRNVLVLGDHKWLFDVIFDPNPFTVGLTKTMTIFFLCTPTLALLSVSDRININVHSCPWCISSKKLYLIACGGLICIFNMICTEL